MPARKGGHEIFAEIGKTGVDKLCDERYNLSCVCGRSSSGRARPCQGRGSEFEPRRPLQKEKPPFGWFFFLERRFCCAKSVACGRVIEREWGNPQRFPPHTPPSLRYARVRTIKPEGNHKKKHHPDRMVFLFGMPRAEWNSLPRPARSASNPEVKAGLPRMALPFVGCREASSSLVYFAAQSAKNKEKPPFGWCFFSYSARRNSGFRSRRPSSAAAICPSRASRSPLRVPFSAR